MKRLTRREFGGAVAGVFTLLNNRSAWAAAPPEGPVGYTLEPVVTGSVAPMYLSSLNDSGDVALDRGGPILRTADGRVHVIAHKREELGGYLGRVRALNNRGQLVFDVIGNGEKLYYWDNGTRTRIPHPQGEVGSLDLNDDGIVVFQIQHGSPDWVEEAFGWRPGLQEAFPIARRRMRVPHQSAGIGAMIWNVKRIIRNARGEMALEALLDPQQYAVLFLDHDSQFHVVEVPARLLSLNDAGVVAYETWDRVREVRVWDRGRVTTVLDIAQPLPNGRPTRVYSAALAREHPNILLELRPPFTVPGQDTDGFLYHYAKGQIEPVAWPGSDLPGGGKVHINTPPDYYGNLRGWTAANDRGHWVFAARLQDGSTGIYRVEPDGELSLVLKEGMETPIGKLRQIDWWGSGVRQNRKGQIALHLQGSSGNVIALLTPSA